jgi:hypothetical protein
MASVSFYACHPTDKLIVLSKIRSGMSPTRVQNTCSMPFLSIEGACVGSGTPSQVTR